MGLFIKVGAPNMLYDFPKFQNLAPKKAFNGISPLIVNVSKYQVVGGAVVENESRPGEISLWGISRV